jgi:biotin transport system substrate-specific component
MTPRALPEAQGALARGLAARSRVWHLGLVLGASWAIALSAQITVPMVPVPMTMQTFAILLVAALGGRALGVQAVAAYLAQGAAGLPVFAGGAGGAAHLVGPTGGYLAGFLAAAWIVGTLSDRGWSRGLVRPTLAVLAGHAAIFALGLAWLQGLVVAVLWWIEGRRRTQPR